MTVSTTPLGRPAASLLAAGALRAIALRMNEAASTMKQFVAATGWGEPWAPGYAIRVRAAAAADELAARMRAAQQAAARIDKVWCASKALPFNRRHAGPSKPAWRRQQAALRRQRAVKRLCK